MIDDTQLALLTNTLGVGVFLLIILYHYVTADKKQEKEQ